MCIFIRCVLMVNKLAGKGLEAPFVSTEFLPIPIKVFFKSSDIS